MWSTGIVQCDVARTVRATTPQPHAGESRACVAVRLSAANGLGNSIVGAIDHVISRAFNCAMGSAAHSVPGNLPSNDIRVVTSTLVVAATCHGRECGRAVHTVHGEAIDEDGDGGAGQE